MTRSFVFLHSEIRQAEPVELAERMLEDLLMSNRTANPESVLVRSATVGDWNESAF
jgi:hypothetical protein